MTPYQLAQARLVREANGRLIEHLNKYGKKAPLPTFMRGFVEGGIFALLVAGFITVPKSGKRRSSKDNKDG